MYITAIKQFWILLFLFPLLTQAQQENFNTEKYEFHYRATYINSDGDTLTIEKLILKPLGRPWIGQLFKQKAIKYIYHTDTAGINKYIDPGSKEKIKKTSSKEVTGIVYNDNEYYMHPPRRNQYKMLFYAPHPQVRLNNLQDSTSYFRQNMVVPGWGRLNIQFTVAPIKERSTFDNVKLWSVIGKGKWKLKKPKPDENIYNSELIATFSKEYGFTKMHYHFEDGKKILFDLVDIKKP